MSAPSVSLWTLGDTVQIPLDRVAVDDVKTTVFERRFNPYDFNGGTIISIAGEDFVVCAGDTRISTGYEILSRNQSKLSTMTEKTILSAAGCTSDIITLQRMLAARLTQYEHSHNTQMSGEAVAQLLSVTLYYRRFFPYYAFCMVGALDEEGKGAVYGYDAVGSFKRDDYGCMGSGQNFIMPILDNLIGHKNRLDKKKPLSAEEVVAIVKECFVVVAERDIYTGDSVEIKVISKEGIVSEQFQLKKD
jgi:20S proteasome subunit beta 6